MQGIIRTIDIFKREFLIPACCFLVLSVISSPLSAENSESKTSIAVFKIKTINCNEAIGTIFEDMLSREFLASGTYVVMDKTQMDRIAVKAGFVDFDITNSKIMAELGRVLNVDKIIIGSVTKSESYTADIRSIDSRTAAVEVIETNTFESTRTINISVKKAAERVERFHLGYGRITGIADFTIFGGAFLPLSHYAEAFESALGGGVQFSLNRIYFDRTSVITTFGAYRYAPKTHRYRTFTQYPFSAGLQIRFRPIKTLYILPSLSSGLIISQVEYDEDGIKSSEGYFYKKEYFNNYFVHFRTEAALYLYDRWMITLTPGYLHIFDTGTSGYCMTFDVGVKTLF